MNRRSRPFVVFAFIAFVAFVIWRSFQVAGHQCTLCMSFGGREACRTVEAATVSEARTGAINNACALLASGVTDSIACERDSGSWPVVGARKNERVGERRQIATFTYPSWA
jgi:hypothetical protein